MIVKTINIGPLQVNNYLVICENTKQAVLIDAGGDFETTKHIIDENNASLVYVLNTHGHFDHTAGNYDLQKKLGAKILIHKNDEFFIKTLKEQLLLYDMPVFEPSVIDEYVEDNQEINVGSLNFKVIHTPGHSSGSVCFLIDNILFSGDTLFCDSVGRTDLPGGSYKEIEKSIKEKIFSLDENIIVYPGHGPATT